MLLKEKRANLVYLLSLPNLTEESLQLFQTQLAEASKRITRFEAVQNE